MSNLKLDTKLIPKLVEEKFDLVKALKEYNPDGRYEYRQPAFCPFHQNENTPAATLYEASDRGPDTLFCFAENRGYTVSDVLGKLMGYNIYEVGHALWNKMTTTEKELFLGRHTSGDLLSAFTPKTTKPLVNNLTTWDNYRTRRITLGTLLEEMVGDIK